MHDSAPDLILGSELYQLELTKLILFSLFRLVVLISSPFPAEGRSNRVKNGPYR